MASSNLPGTKRAFSLKAGEGDRYIFGSQLATVLARNIDTGGLFEFVVYSGGKGTYFPLHRHAQAHEAIIVLSGRLILHLDSKDFLLSPGDYASIPAGIVHGHRFVTSHHRVDMDDWWDSRRYVPDPRLALQRIRTSGTKRFRH